MAEPDLIERFHRASPANIPLISDSREGPGETILNNSGEPIITAARIYHDSVSTELDAEWVTNAFMVKNKDMEEIDLVNRFRSSADSKFTDTTAGGNMGINNKPQFTRYADIRSQGRLEGRNPVSIASISGNHGMGRYYSEAIDDHEQVIFMEFGVPKFNSFTRFFSLAMDPNASYTANTGRTSIFYTIGKTIGIGMSIVAFPIIGIALWVTKLAPKILANSSSKYYSLKPTMYLYWDTVNTLMTAMTVDLGIFPASLTTDDPDNLGDQMTVDKGHLATLHKLMPTIFGDDHYIDVYAIATRAQRLAQEQAHREYAMFTDEAYTDFTGLVKKAGVDKISDPKGSHSFSNWINEILNFHTDFSLEYGKEKDIVIETKIGDKKIPTTPTTEVDKSSSGIFDSISNGYRVAEKWMTGVGQYFEANVKDGGAFASFKVDYTGTASESFSNSVKDIEAASIINSVSGGARSIKFNLSGGNISDNFLSDALEYGASAITQFASGGLSGVTFEMSNIVAALLGGGYIDIPKQWENSSVTLNKSTYTMDLVTPYGNPLSLIQSIYLPMSMMLAGALPLATGKNSYTSPLLCSLYDRGKSTIKLGIIDSLNIERGTTNLGFTKDGKPLGVKITFTVLDLSSLMAVPISSGGIFGVDMTLDEDHLLANYISTITGRSLYSQKYVAQKAMYNLAKTRFQVSRLTSPARFGMLLSDTFLSGMFSFVSGSGNQVIPR